MDKRWKRVVVYCGAHSCEAVLGGAKILEDKGFSRVATYTGTMKALYDAGLVVYRSGVYG